MTTKEEMSYDELFDERDRLWNEIEDRNTDVLPFVRQILEVEKQLTIHRIIG